MFAVTEQKSPDNGHLTLQAATSCTPTIVWLPGRGKNGIDGKVMQETERGVLWKREKGLRDSNRDGKNK